jgi:hypothetical protein
VWNSACSGNTGKASTHLLFFFDFSISPDYLIAVFDYEDDDDWEDDSG